MRHRVGQPGGVSASRENAAMTSRISMHTHKRLLPRRFVRCCLAIIAIGALTMGTIGCAADPPRIARESVAGFWVTPAKMDEPDYPFYRLGGRPRLLIEMYNRASGHSFNHEGSVRLRAGFVLQDGTTIRLEFSDQFPRDCLLVYLDPPGAKTEPLYAGQPGTAPLGKTQYEVKSPGLAALVYNLAGQHIDPEIVGPWLWPTL